MKHAYLFQGPSSHFFRKVGQQLCARDWSVTRVCPSFGDRLFWSADAGRALRFCGQQKDYRKWLERVWQRDPPTDVLMLGDGRFYHGEALRVARHLKQPPQIWIVEHGYIRPGHILLEPDGMGAASRIPEKFSTWSVGAPMEASSDPILPASFAEYALWDVVYQLSGLFANPLYNRHYIRSSKTHPLLEYGGWIGKALRRPMSAWEDRQSEMQWSSGVAGARFIVPLQLSSDFQLLQHGCGEAQEATVARVIRSFAQHAPPGATLLFKRHPLDNGRTRWGRHVTSAAEKSGVSDRVCYLRGGALDALLGKAAGLVTINSTAGLRALQLNVPTKVLGTAVYDLPGLTAHEKLDEFWSAPQAPDKHLVEQFCDFLISEYHVAGSFDGPGMNVAAEMIADRLDPATRKNV